VGFAHVSCPTRSMVYALRRCRKALYNEEILEMIPLHTGLKKEGSNLNFIGFAFRVFRLLIMISKINLLTSHPLV
jgi:hypothetical protein